MKSNYNKILLTIATIVIICGISISSIVSATLTRKNNQKLIHVTTENSTIETLAPKISTLKETTTSELISSTTKKTTKTDCETIVTNPVTTNAVEVSKLTYTEDDSFYLAAAVCREAGGSSEEIQMLVANVVINRVESSLYPNTIYDVLTQHMQYGTMWKYGISFPSWATEEVKEQCYSVAKRILGGERVCPDNVIFQAEFAQGSGIYKKIDNFYFCYQ